MMNNYAEMIKSSVTMKQALEFYGFNIYRGNRIACPFHGGKGANLGFSEDVWHCFVCGARGDLLSFVQDYFKLDFKNAIRMINRDFNLGLPIDEAERSIQRFEEARQRAQQYRERRERDLKAREMLENEFLSALEAWLELDSLRRTYAPTSPTDAIDDRYVYAVMHIQEAEARLDDAEGARRAYDYRRHNNNDADSD